MLELSNPAAPSQFMPPPELHKGSGISGPKNPNNQLFKWKIQNSEPTFCYPTLKVGEKKLPLKF